MKYQILHDLTPEYIEKLKARFWAKVDTSGGSAACWEWTAGKIVTGYGKIGVKLQYQLAHRVSYELNTAPIPNEFHVLHRCDNRACVNPGHLFVGTNDDNIADKVSKGRQRTPKGVKNGQSKLTPVAVRDIRQNYKPGTRSRWGAKRYSLTHFARKYDVSKATVISVLRYETWTHVQS